MSKGSATRNTDATNYKGSVSGSVVASKKTGPGEGKIFGWAGLEEEVEKEAKEIWPIRQNHDR